MFGACSRNLLMRPPAILVSFSSATGVDWNRFDVCGWFFEDASITCDDRGICQEPPEAISWQSMVTCEDAARSLSNQHGSRPLTELSSGGQLRQPHMQQSTRWPPPDLARAVILTNREYAPPPPVIKYLEKLIGNIKLLTDELNFWAPRVVYVPARVLKILRAVRESEVKIHIASEGQNAALKLFVIRAFTKSPIIDEFYTQVTDLWHVISKMGNVRENGYLKSLIPFLHVYAELTSRYPLPFAHAPGFHAADLHLLQTISQFHPMSVEIPDNDQPAVLRPVWTLRVIDTESTGWDSYVWERFWLPMGPQLEARSLKQIFRSLGCDHQVIDAQCIASIQLMANMYSDSDAPNRLPMAEFVTNLLYLFETLPHISPTMDVLVAAIEETFSLIGHMSLSDFAAVRVRAQLYIYFRSCTTIVDRILSAFLLPPGRQQTRSRNRASDAPLEVRGDTAQAMVDFVISKRVFELHANFLKFLDVPWIHRFFEIVVRDSLMDGSTVALKPTVGNDFRRAIGRILAYTLWRADIEPVIALVEVNVENAEPGNMSYLDVLFFGSGVVRCGFYDWFSFDALENYVGIEELGDALRLYSTRSYYDSENVRNT